MKKNNNPIGTWKPLTLAALLAMAASGAAHAQAWVRFVEYQVQVDNRDRLTIHRDGRWEVSGDGSGDPFGLVNGNTKSGSGFAGMTAYAAFPSPWSLDRNLRRWNVEVIAGRAPRCPAVEAGSNPDRTISVIEHTEDQVVILARDDGGCGTSGRVTCTVRVSYQAPDLPSIGRQPVGATVLEDQRVELLVAATGGSLSYAWRRNGLPIPAANAESLVIPATRLRDAADYDVVVSNPVGTAISQAARIAIVPTPVNVSIRRLSSDWVEVSWNTLTDNLYTVQWSADFRNWFSNGKRVAGTGGHVAQRIQVIPGLAEYYRLLVEPE